MQHGVSRQNTNSNKIIKYVERDEYQQNLPNKGEIQEIHPCTPVSFLEVLTHTPYPIPVNWQHQCP